MDIESLVGVALSMVDRAALAGTQFGRGTGSGFQRESSLSVLDFERYASGMPGARRRAVARCVSSLTHLSLSLSLVPAGRRLA
jgi:hypothetical protein